jgi:enoyl-CoA hydratase
MPPAWGAGARFCAGADLKAIGGPDRNRTEPDGDGPMGRPGCA